MSSDTSAPQGASLKPLSHALGAEVTGLNLAAISDSDFAWIHQSWLGHLVLLFRDQELTVRQQIEFSRRFGELEPAPVNVQGKPWIEAHPEVAVM